MTSKRMANLGLALHSVNPLLTRWAKTQRETHCLAVVWCLAHETCGILMLYCYVHWSLPTGSTSLCSCLTVTLKVFCLLCTVSVCLHLHLQPHCGSWSTFLAYCFQPGRPHHWHHPDGHPMFSCLHDGYLRD